MAFKELSCERFVAELASKAPVPGGGGASALVGAVGTALGQMVGSLTVGKAKYAAVEPRVRALMAEAEALQAELLALMERDAAVFEPLSRAYGLPRDTEAARAHKDAVMEEALQACSEVPLAIMEAVARAVELLRELGELGSTLAVSDAGVGLSFCRSALEGASLNVFINTRMMKNRALAEDINRRADELLREHTLRAEVAYARIKTLLRRPK